MDADERSYAIVLSILGEATRDIYVSHAEANLNLMTFSINKIQFNSILQHKLLGKAEKNAYTENHR